MNDSGERTDGLDPARPTDDDHTPAETEQTIGAPRPDEPVPAPAAPEPPPEAAATEQADPPAAEPAAPEAESAEAAEEPKPRPDAQQPPKAEPSGDGAPKGDERNSKRKGSGRPAPKIPWDEPLALVRYGRMSRIGLFRHNLDPLPQRDTQLVLRTDRGVELGVLITGLSGDGAVRPDAETDSDAPDEHLQAAAADCNGACLLSCKRLAALAGEGKSEFSYHKQNKILRLASPQDLNDQVHLDRSEREKRQFCEQQAGELGLKMRLVAVEHLLGGERVVFYFTSESRVDFRELVRRLAGQYRTRIEMRQIGARDEARLVADYERCGRQCCCQVFLGSLQPVSIRMAKVQKATLDPSKISGRCNRLMCCLRFEDQTYEQLRKTLPKKNVWVRTEETIGKVVSTQILTQLVRIVDVHGAMSVVDSAAILERGVEPPSPTETARTRRTRPPAAREVEAAADAAQAKAEPATDASTETQDAPDRKRRRRRRRRRKSSDGAAPAEQAQTAPSPVRGGEGAEPRKKRRRRRRRRSKGSGSNGGGSAPPSA